MTKRVRIFIMIYTGLKEIKKKGVHVAKVNKEVVKKKTKFKKKKYGPTLQGDRRNPCIFYRKSVDNFGQWVIHKSYGFIQDRDVKNQMYFIMTGNGGDERWYDYEDVELVKGHWTNKKRKTNNEEEDES